MTSLQSSIDLLYEVFADVHRPTHIEGCPCCIENKNICTLLSKPLRELSPDDLSSYASSAFLTVGNTSDYLYFLPRIMEISITDMGWWPDPEVTGRAIAETFPAEWPMHRQNALDKLLKAIFITDALDLNLDSWMCAASRMNLDVMPYLSIIQRSPSQLIKFYESNSHTLIKKRKLSNAFWDESTLGYSQIVDWFRSDTVVAIISQAYGIQSEQDAAANP